MEQSKNTEQIISPLKAIRARCLDCCAGQAQEVKLCPAQNCPLYPFRLGKNPFRKSREYSPEQIEQMRTRLEQARNAKNS